MRTLTRTGMALTVLAMAFALSWAAAGPATAGSGHDAEGGPMAAFSDLNYQPDASSTVGGPMAAFSDPDWSPATSTSVTGRRGAFSDLNYIPATRPSTVGYGAFSDLNVFGPIPKVSSAHVAAHTAVVGSSHAWTTTDWRTIGLTTIAGLLVLSLALVGTLYLRGRRPAI